MDSVNFPHANVCLTAPKGWDEEVDGPINDLHAYHDGTCFFSYWRPTDEELDILQDGGFIQLGIMSNDHPPVHVGVVPTDDDEPEDMPIDDPVDPNTNIDGAVVALEFPKEVEPEYEAA